MGKADWECYTGCDCIYWDASRDDLRIYCYWKCNGWRYNMSPVYGYTYFQGGNEACVFDGGINFQDNQSTNLLGYHDYTVWRGHSTISSSYQSRIISNSSYESGDKWSGKGWYDTGGVTHTVITYNANGGSGQPENQDKWYGESLWLSNTRPTRTGYTFRCWNTASNGTGTTYNPGQQYTPDPGGTVTLYAIWDVNTWQVSYNGNSDNVTNVPSAQTKTYGQTLTLSSQIPQKVDYNFLGWNTEADGTGTTYQPGASFTTNAATVLYAQWELAYVKPRIKKLTIARCDSAGNTTETGTNLRIDFDWITDLTETYAKIQYKKQTDSTWTTSNIFGPNDNKSGTVTKKVIGSNNIDTEYSYVARIYIYDSKGSSDENYITYSGEFSIGTIKYPIDVKAEGSGVAFGKVAERDNTFDIGFDNIYFKNNPLYLAIYPIGSIFETTDENFNPNTVFGGTWTKIYNHYIIRHLGSQVIWQNEWHASNGPIAKTPVIGAYGTDLIAGAAGTQADFWKYRMLKGYKLKFGMTANIVTGGDNNGRIYLNSKLMVEKRNMVW